ncbi:hypothetical protein CRV00_11765 [Malaciobacter molluscorum]|uniref:hypothetical protein n=1 Tax=Malaciobacter molluscorum TaxID=1032072 RepID=UPI00100BDE9E|nr:hypothetical protein [Malaciobacter molluscorum]RXJ93324.1 hypothetical protein CRV00_11765 [Malaciobacter molluscorum]
MKFSLKVLLTVIVIILAAIIITPNIYSTKINQSIEETQKQLQTIGINNEIKNTADTYFNVKREYILTVTDSTFIFNKIMEKYKNSFNPRTVKNIKERLLNNSQFLVSLDLKKYPFGDDKIKITLKNLSDNIQKELKKDNIGRQLLEFIQKDGLELNISIKNMKLKKAKLKDIDLKISDKYNSITQVVKNYIITFKDLNNYTINIEKLKTLILVNYQIFQLDGESFSTSKEKQDDYNSKKETKAKNISFKFTSMYSRGFTEGEIKDLDIISKTKLVDNSVDLNEKLTAQNIYLHKNNIKLKFKNLKSDISLLNVDKDIIKNIENIFFIIDNRNFNKYITNQVNKGFKINLDNFSIDSTNVSFHNDELKLDKFAINSKFELKNNNIKVSRRPLDEIIKNIYLSANAVLQKNDLLKIMSKLNLPNDFLNYVKIKNDKAHIDAEFKDSQLFINDKVVK